MKDHESTCLPDHLRSISLVGAHMNPQADACGSGGASLNCPET